MKIVTSNLSQMPTASQKYQFKINNSFTNDFNWTQLIHVTENSNILHSYIYHVLHKALAKQLCVNQILFHILWRNVLLAIARPTQPQLINWSEVCQVQLQTPSCWLQVHRRLRQTKRLFDAAKSQPYSSELIRSGPGCQNIVLATA